MSSFPSHYAHPITAIALRKPRLTKHPVLKGNLTVMRGTWLEQATLHATQWLECPGCDFDVRTKLARDRLLEDIPQWQQAVVFVVHSASSLRCTALGA